MKEKELRDLAVCAGCGNKVGHTGLPLFYKVTVERFGIDMKAVSRQDGLGAFLGGQYGIAHVMGPHEDLAKEIGDPSVVSICENCGNEGKVCIAALHERQAGVSPR